MRPADLVADGINVRNSKLRNKPHFVPLTSAQMAEIKSWGVRELEFFIATARRQTFCRELPQSRVAGMASLGRRRIYP